MKLTLLHRPGGKRDRFFYQLQQEYAHDLGLKVTLLLDYESMLDEEEVALAKEYAATFGDELGIWLTDQSGMEFEDREMGVEPIWLLPEDEKRFAIETAVSKFRETFDQEPISVGAYHMDAFSLRVLREVSPATKISVAGCFEEGVRVFHGCNNSWYLFNEGMPWGPWYPSKTHSLRPATDEQDAVGVVAIPHLSRDLVLSYEGRNDFFASHPANVQRAMANIGVEAPYNYNLVDQHRLQEDYNDGFSFLHVFVGAGWIAGHPTVQDPFEVSSKMYQEYLAHLAHLREDGELDDMYMSEFADWYRAHVPVGKPQVALAKDVLYGSGKHYFWYIDGYCRVLVDATQGGSIGDLRPFSGQLDWSPGIDSPALWYGSYPYIIQSQHRSGISHHSQDGARTTLMVSHQGETIDLGTCPTKVADIQRDETGTTLKLTPAALKFSRGLSAMIETTYHFTGEGQIQITRKLASLSDPQATLTVQEYFKGCYGVTEYPQDLRGITLSVTGANAHSLPYQFHRRQISTGQATAVSARVPQANVDIILETAGIPAHMGQAKEGHLFSPYFTLTLDYTLTQNQETHTWLRINRAN